jgi:hypothetical protein
MQVNEHFLNHTSTSDYTSLWSKTETAMNTNIEWLEVSSGTTHFEANYSKSIPLLPESVVYKIVEDGMPTLDFSFKVSAQSIMCRKTFALLSS